jgi:hypothetical protein
MGLAGQTGPMSDRGTRRDFLKAATVSLGSAMLLPAAGKTSQANDATIDRVQRMLAAPLEGNALALLKRAAASREGVAAARWRYKLPENSEPCTFFTPTRHAGKR